MNTTEQRLIDLTNNLNLLYEKLGFFEQEEIKAEGPKAKFTIQQTIKTEIFPKIIKYEKEYWQLCPIDAILISEEEATTELVKVQQAVQDIQSSNNNNYPQKILELLEDIQTKLNDSDKAAAAKLKVVIPLLPMIAYELEIDTESFIYKTLESVRRLVKKKR